MNIRRRCKSSALLFVAGALAAHAGDITGVVMDKELNEPLMGASIRIAGTRLGTTADIDGKFRLRNLKKGTYTIEVSYVSFFPQKMTLQVPATGEVSVTVEMTTDDKQLSEVTVTARKNLELERALLAERQKAVLSIENLGASEMSIKGISNVQEYMKFQSSSCSGSNIGCVPHILLNMKMGTRLHVLFWQAFFASCFSQRRMLSDCLTQAWYRESRFDTR